MARLIPPNPAQSRLIETLGSENLARIPVEISQDSSDLYAQGAAAPERIRQRADDACLRGLARAVTGGLGGQVGIAPRVFLKKLVQDVLDRIDLHPAFDPRRDYALTLADGELTDVERNARAARTPDDVELDP